MVRKGMGKGTGKGYKNLIGKDKLVHRMSAKGIKQPQKVCPIATGKITQCDNPYYFNKKQQTKNNKYQEPELVYRINYKSVQFKDSEKAREESRKAKENFDKLDKQYKSMKDNLDSAIENKKIGFGTAFFYGADIQQVLLDRDYWYSKWQFAKEGYDFDKSDNFF